MLLFLLIFLKDVSQSCQNCINPSALHAAGRRASEFKHEFPESENTQTFYPSPEALKSSDRLVAENRLTEIDVTC